MRSDLSTGSPEFDRHLGGILPGDSILLVQTHRAESLPLLRSAIDALRRRDGRVVYPGLAGSRQFLLHGVRVSAPDPPRGAAGRSSAAVRRWYLSAIGALGRGDLLLLDDLGDLAAAGGGGEAVALDLFMRGAAAVKRRKALLIATAVRSALGGQTLARLKDLSTICLELTTHEGDMLLRPIRLQGRYPSGAGSPFGFRLARRSGERRLVPVQGFDTPRGSHLRERIAGQERTAASILEGPLSGLPVGLVVADLRGSLLVMNERARGILRLPPLGDGPAVAPAGMVERSSASVFLRFLAAARAGRTAETQTVFRAADGTAVTVHLRAMPAGDGLTLFLCEGAQKRAGRTPILQAGDAFPLAFCVADRKTVLASNAAFRRLCGNERVGRDGVPLRDLFTRRTIRDLHAFSDSDAASGRIDGGILRGEGPGISVRLHVSRAGDAAGTLLVGVEDISEFESALSVLRGGEARYRSVAEQITRPIALVTTGEIRYANPACAALLGVVAPGTLTGRRLDGFLPEADRRAFEEAAASFLASRQASKEISATIVRPGAGEAESVSVRIVLSKPGAGSGQELLVEFEDVTARRREADRVSEMRDGTDRMRSILEAATGTLEEEKLVHVALDRSLEILGWSGGAVFLLDGPGETYTPAASRHMPKKILESLSAVPAQEGLGGFLSKTMESHVFPLDRYPGFLPYRTLFRGRGLRRVSFVPLAHAERPVGFILGVSGDDGDAAAPAPVESLTALGRQLGNALANARRLRAARDAEARLRLVVESLSGVVYTAGPDGTISTVDASVSGLLGYQPRDFARNRALFLSLIHEDDKGVYLERVTASQTLGESFVREYRMRPKAKASFLWIRDSATVLRGRSGAVEGFTGILSDVTADRERFRSVSEERTILRAAHDALPEGVALFDGDGVCVEWNPTMEVITGIPRAGALGRAAEGLAPVPERIGADEIARAVQTRSPAKLGMVEPPAAAGARYEVFLAPSQTGGGSDRGFLLRYADVTARQSELDTLLRSEKILLNVINAMDDVMMITDLEGRVVEINQAFLKVMRYSRSQVVGREFPYPWLVEADMGRFVEWINRIREQQWLHDFDVTWIARGGTEVRMSLNTTLIRNSMGEPVAMLNVLRDISDRVSLAQGVEEQKNRIEMINRIHAAALGTGEFPDIFGVVAEEVVRLLPAHAVFFLAPGDPADSFSQAAAFDGLPLQAAELAPLAAAFGAVGPDAERCELIGDLGLDARTAGRRIAGDRFRSAALVAVPAGDTPASILGAASREPHAFGEPHAAVLRQLAHELGGILQRLRLHRRVVADSAYIRNLLDSIDHPVYTVDRSFTITRINAAGSAWLAEVTGRGAASFVGGRLPDLFPDAPLREAISTALARVASGETDRHADEVAAGSPGGPSVMQLVVTPLREGGRTEGFVLSHTDITSLKATERELRERANQLLTLHEISGVLSNTFDIGSVLQTALALLRSALGARGVMVYLLNPADGGLDLAHQDGFPPESAAGVARLDLDSSITGAVIRRRASSYIRDGVSADPRIASANREFLQRHSLQAMAVVPIIAKENVFGALDLFYDRPHEFSEQERQVLDLAGNQLGAAVENVHLYRELTAQVERLSVLFELSQKLTSLLDTAEICRTAFEHIRRAVAIDRCTMLLLDRSTRRLSPVLRAVREGSGFRLEHHPAAGAAGPLAEEVVSARATRRDPGGRTVVVPMVSEEIITGVIEVSGAGRTPFDDVQVRMLESVGYLAAIAVEKAGLYEETVHTSEQIAQRNRELDDFTYVVSHDLKEPLISVEGFSRILQTDYAGVIGAEGREYLESMIGAATRMKGLIDDLLMLSRVSRPPEAFARVDLGAVADEIRKDMEFTLRKRNVDLRIAPGLPAVRGNETHLKILLRNLIGNAVKFNDKPAPVVEVGFRSQENNTYLLWVKDNGIGIEPEYFEKIFVIFQRLHRREEFEGSGAGLAIVKKIMEIHQGRIWVESQKGTGSMFCFTLPAGGAA